MTYVIMPAGDRVALRNDRMGVIMITSSALVDGFHFYRFRLLVVLLLRRAGERGYPDH